MTGSPTERPVSFPSGGLLLRGILGMPDGARSCGRGVVLVHGWGGYRIGPHRILVRTARLLLGRGFATLRFDLRGRGDSEGDGTMTDLDGMIEDTSNAVGFLRQECDVGRIALLGICSGANVAVGVAGMDPGVSELVLWSVLPFKSQRPLRRRIARMRHYGLVYLRKALSAGTWARLLRGEVRIGGAFRAIVGEPAGISRGRDLKDSRRDLMSAFASFRGRALFVTGTLDPEGMEGRRIFMPFCRRHGIRAEFELVEGADHSYYDPAHAEAVVERTLSWLLDESASGGTR